MNLKNVFVLILVLTASIDLAASDSSFQTASSSNEAIKGENLVWDELTALSTTHTWDARTFSGFYYDLDSDKYSESLTITDIGRTIDYGNIVYEAIPVEKSFKRSEWGKYTTISFLGDEYFAAYTNNTTIEESENTSLLAAGKLGMILLDEDDSFPIYADSCILLEEGYALDIVEVNVTENTVNVSLTKDGVEVDRVTIPSNTDYVYKKNRGDADNVTIISIHFKDTYQDTPSNAVFVEGMFQISDNYLKLESGDTFSNMQIKAVDDTEIRMINPHSIFLAKNSNIGLMGNILLRIADSDTLRFSPSVDRSVPGTYGLRGTVAENKTYTWTPLNFEGFYYDINTSVGTEKLDIIDLNGRIIEAGDLEYTSTIQEVDFKANFSDLDPANFPAKYPAMCLFGEMYVPLTNSTPDKLTKLLIDNNENYILALEETLAINDEYTLFLKHINTDNKMAWLELSRNGEEIHDQIITIGNYGDTIVYEEDIEDQDDVEIMRIHLNNVALNNTVTIDGIWLRDDKNIVEMNIGDPFTKLSVSEIGKNYLKMTNDETITLIRDSVVDIVGNFVFRVADDDVLRYYPYTEITTSSELSIYTFTPDTLNPESYEGDSISFSIVLSEKADVTWIMDEEKLYKNNSVTTASCSNRSANIGMHNLIAIAENENGNVQKQWTWIVEEHPLEFIDLEPASYCSMVIGESKIFYARAIQNCTIEWYLNDILVQTDQNISTSTYNFDSLINNISSPLTYRIKAIASNQNETYENEWRCYVKKKTLREGQTWELKDGYTLTPSLIDGNGDKTLISLSKNEELLDQHIVSTDSYYCYNRTLNGSEQNLIKAYVADIYRGQIDSLIVITEIAQYSDTGTLDTDPTRLLELEGVWNLGNGYSIKAVDIGEKEDYCVLFLDKDGTTVDERIMSDSDAYEYQRMDEYTNNVKTILELPVLSGFYSHSGSYVEFLNNYTLYPDENTVDINLLLLIPAGDKWNLGNGYSVTVEEISDKKALFSIEKEGTIVDRVIIDENSNYKYERSDLVTKEILQIITINSSKIFDGYSENFVEFYSDYQINSDAGTVALDDKTLMEPGESAELNEGYCLNLVSTDINVDKAYFNLTKNGQLYDELILRSGEYYHFNRSVNGTEQTIISFLLDNVFTGETNRVAIVKEIVQNPDVIIDEITITEKDNVKIRSNIYSGTGLDDIISLGNDDYIEINASTFAGFFYNMDEGVSTETLRIFGGNYSNRNTVDINGIVYTTRLAPIKFASDNIDGDYNVIGLFGESYAPLKTNRQDEVAKILVDSDEKQVLSLGEPLELPEGYSIEAKQIDVEGEKVWMELTKDGEFIEDEVIDVPNTGETWIYDKDIGEEEDVVLMAMNVTSIFRADSDGIVIIEGLWLIDFDNIIQVDIGDQFGEMQVTEIGTDYLKFSNPSQINLTKDSSIKIANDLFFEVEDNEHLSFCIAKETDNSTTHEIRGSISENAIISEWTSMNFKGFYYDFGGDAETEKLSVELSDRNIEENDLIYETVSMQAGFEREEWGEYTAIGFLGEKYLTAYTESTAFDTSTTNLLSSAMLSRVLMDDNDSYVLYPHSRIILEDGYELGVRAINASNNSVILSISKDEAEVDTAIVHANSDYTYKTDLSLVNNVTTIAVHFNGITNDSDTNSISIEGIFQISDECLNLDIGDTYGKVKISCISADSISMDNGNDILLSKDSSINITENIHFRVADDDDIRFYPFMMINAPSLEFHTLTPGNHDLEMETGSTQNFDITANNICNFTWMVNDIAMQANISCTSSFYSYTPASAGSYNVTIVAETATEKIHDTWNIVVTSKESTTTTTPSSGGSSDGGGGGGSTGEDYDNILKKEVIREIVNKDTETSYYFEEELNALESIKFTALKNSGPISATIEVLKGSSSFTDTAPSDIVYQNMNIWIGKKGFATPENIKDVRIQFKVAKTWIKENGIIESSICLCRYNDDSWNQLSTLKVDEDENYIYFISETPGFSPFAITGNTGKELSGQEDTRYNQPIGDIQSDTPTSGNESEDKSTEQSTNTPGVSVGLIATIVSFAALVLRKRN